ncbi:unnamed protein product [Prorocentrum cordatum]|uniref:Uncharacterized protein n=1 Tax=Prorocentrum cordatum TaxID=2364126 RepID=A0ABN9VJL6_9DINO|nr:unnamed protein product [Polarella glacialis]
MLSSLQKVADSADKASKALFDELFGCGADSAVRGQEELKVGPCEDFVDVGEGKRHQGRLPQPGSVAKGIDETMLDSSVRRGIVVQLRPRPCLYLAGRELVLQSDDSEDLDAEPQKRVICGICYKSNCVPARACVIDCGACGGRNLAGDDTGVRVRCYNCGVSNLAEPGAGCISCSACKAVVAVPSDEDAARGGA